MSVGRLSVRRLSVRRLGVFGTALIAGIFVALALAGCAAASGGGTGGGTSASPSPSPSTTPAAETWRFVSGTDGNGAFTADGAVVTLKIDGANSGGQGPCNAFGATVTGSTSGAISIVVGIHTMMACSEAVRNVTESRYFAALDKVTHSSISSGDLTLAGGGVSLIFARART